MFHRFFDLIHLLHRPLRRHLTILGLARRRPGAFSRLGGLPGHPSGILRAAGNTVHDLLNGFVLIVGSGRHCRNGFGDRIGRFGGLIDIRSQLVGGPAQQLRILPNIQDQ